MTNRTGRKTLEKIAKENRTKRGLARDQLLKSKRVLDPNNATHRKKLLTYKGKKNIFQLYDVVGIDLHPKSRSISKYKPRAAKKSSSNVVRKNKHGHKYNYPKHYLKKDGKLKKAFRKKAAQWQREH